MTRDFSGRVKSLTAAITLATGLISSSAMAAAPAMVTSEADNGPGTLREALASGAGVISIYPQVSTIVIDTPLVYDGTEPLSIIGVGQTIQASNTGNDFTLLEVSNGANLDIMNLNFEGVGGFDLNNPGDGKGIYVKVPQTRTGVVRLALTNVEVSDVANHGIHVSDCTLGDACGSGSGGGGEGSPASVQVILTRVGVENAGNGKFDADGLRVDERNDGDIMLTLNKGDFYGVGADGIELDEGNNGDVHIDVKNVHLERNGGYCENAPLDLAHPCIEDDDGTLVRDLDDGMDIDEAGDGSVLGSVTYAIVEDNLDEGLDFDEEGDGGMNLRLWLVDAMNNGDEGIKLSSANAGNVNATLAGVDVRDNNDDGIQIEAEDGDGEVHVTFQNSRSEGNAKDGLNLSQENATDQGTLLLRGFTDVDSIDLENVNQL